MATKRESSFRERVWFRQGLLPTAVHLTLRPASAIFATGVRVRSLLYGLRLRRGARLGIPVVSIGNLSVGGTGKTPTALWLGGGLAACGIRVAILSRGYGGRITKPTVVGRYVPEGLPASDDFAEVGDEALMLSRRFEGHVVVARERLRAGRLAEERLGVDVVLLDDGFQHRQLARDFDLVLIRPEEVERGTLLPAGNLREPRRALRRADAVVVTKGRLSATGDRRLRGWLGDKPVYHGELRASALVTPMAGRWQELPMGHLAGRRVFAISAIAHPAPFYESLYQWEARVEDFMEFPDHHAYGTEDWKKIALRSRELELVVTTEKDLVKLERFPFAKEKLVALRTSMEVDGGDDLVERVVERIRAVAAARGRV